MSFLKGMKDVLFQLGYNQANAVTQACPTPLHIKSSHKTPDCKVSLVEAQTEGTCCAGNLTAAQKLMKMNAS